MRKSGTMNNIQYPIIQVLYKKVISVTTTWGE